MWNKFRDIPTSSTCPTPFAFKDPIIPWLVQFTLHFAVSSVLYQCTNPETHRWKLSLDADIQTQLNVEISNGQENSFTAETDLNQRKLASTLKWSHYKFNSSENHRQMNQVHMPVVWISYWAELVLQRRFCKRMSDPSVAVCKRKVF